MKTKIKTLLYPLFALVLGIFHTNGYTQSVSGNAQKCNTKSIAQLMVGAENEKPEYDTFVWRTFTKSTVIESSNRSAIKYISDELQVFQILNKKTNKMVLFINIPAAIDEKHTLDIKSLQNGIEKVSAQNFSLECIDMNGYTLWSVIKRDWGFDLSPKKLAELNAKRLKDDEVAEKRAKAEAARAEAAAAREAERRRAYEQTPEGRAEMQRRQQGLQMCMAQKKTCQASCPPYRMEDSDSMKQFSISCERKCDEITCNY